MSLKNSPSLLRKRQHSRESLPRLNQILQPGLKHVKGDRTRKKRIQGALMMVEGHSKVIEQAREDQKGRHLDR